MPKLKIRLAALALACAGLLAVPALAQGAVNFGSRLNHDPANSGECANQTGETCTIASFIHPSDPEGDPYSGGAPVDGVITKFRIRAWVGPDPGKVTLRLADVKPDAPNSDNALATSVGTGPTETLAPNLELLEAPIQEFAARLPVKKGQHLALDTNGSVQATVNDSGSKFSYVYAPPLVDGQGARGSLESTGELLVAATIEPDADGDGFGDETQDQCPSQASTQGACDTAKPVVGGLAVSNGLISYTLSEAATVTLRLEKMQPGRKVGRKCVKQTRENKKKKRCFTLRKIGAVFAGGGAVGANTVALPSGTKLKPGRYLLTATARDAAGNESVTTTEFTIKKKKKKKR